MYLPLYRAWVVVVSLVGVRARAGSSSRRRSSARTCAPGTENPKLLQAFGVNVPLMFTITYGFGVALAAFAGVMAAPVYQVTPLMGSSVIMVVFAVVVIGGMGSIAGSIVTGIGIGLVEGLTRYLYPEASSGGGVRASWRSSSSSGPAGLFGRER